jgi:O-antigen/teichoic acid export membrane protein
MDSEARRDRLAVLGIRDVSRHLVVTATAWLSRLITAIVQLVAIRLVLEHLGSEDYAMFALLIGLTGWFALLDLGLGYSVQNAISESRAKDLSHVAIVGAVLLASVLLLVIWSTVISVIAPHASAIYLGRFDSGSITVADKRDLMLFAALLLTLAAVGGVMYRIWYGEQRGYLANLLTSIGSVAGLLGMWFALQSDLDRKLLWILILYLAPAALLPAIAMGWRLAFVHPRPNNARSVSSLLPRALEFWTFALMSSAVLSIDYLVMSQLLSSLEIVSYVLTTKVLGFVLTVYGAALMALWPVLSELGANHRWHEMLGTVRRYVAIGIGAAVVCTILTLLLRTEIADLLGAKGGEALPVSLILMTGFYIVVRVWTDSFAILLQSINDLRVFMMWVPLQAVICVALQWILAPVWGAQGVIVALLLSFVFTVTWVLPHRFRSRYLAT